MSLINDYIKLLPDYMRVMREKGKPTCWLPRSQAIQYERFCGHFDNRYFLIVDHDSATCRAEKLYDLEPNVVVYNPTRTERHQSFWRIRDAVHCQADAKSRKAYRYLRAIEAAYDEKYGADVHFSRHIHKNPVWWAADTDWRHDRAYTLSELAEVVDLNSYRIKRGARLVTDQCSRNVTLFNDLRHWSYPQAINAQSTLDYDSWHSKVVTRAISYNTFANPLALAEVLVIARSVAEFCYFRYRRMGATMTDSYRELQAKRGSIGGKKSRGGGRTALIDSENAQRIELMLTMKYTLAEIADRLQVSLSTIKRYIRSNKC